MDESAPNAAEKSFGADVAEDVDVEGMRFEVELYGVDIFDTEMEDNLCSTSEGDNFNESLTHFALGFIQHLCHLSFATLPQSSCTQPLRSHHTCITEHQLLRIAKRSSLSQGS